MEYNQNNEKVFKSKELFTAGEIANMIGVSYKTICHYHKIGLLEPVDYTESGYRLFGKETVMDLQKILMLRYLDFSLGEIKSMMKKESNKESFARQEKLIKAQIEHLKQILTAVEKIQEDNERDKWDEILRIIDLTKQKEEILNQYSESSNLQKRISIHEYSTSRISWYQWVLNGLELRKGMKVLEVGCGNGMLWDSICEQLPDDMEIILTDRSESMIKDVENRMEKHKELLKSKNIRFAFLHMSAEDLEFKEWEFDRIIANHMLYHLSEESRMELFKKCNEFLKEDGIFYASTVGNTHLCQLFQLLKEFDDRFIEPSWFSEEFELENGEEQLVRFFSKISMDEQKNDLLVPDPNAIYEYIISLPGEGTNILMERKKECMQFLESRISSEKPFYIHKSAGAFKALKKI